MEYGGITPLGLPAGWPILIDQAVAQTDTVVIGLGLRRSKLWVPGYVMRFMQKPFKGVDVSACHNQ
jgi:prolyl-tRNA editing enzyme YbaK/EbsC (Cys-tRNA(Pro) deacylase)